MLLHSILSLTVCTLAVAQSIPIAAVDYTPTFATCPKGFSLVRPAGSSPTDQCLSSGEKSYIHNRRSKVLPNAWKSYLSNVKATNITLPSYVSSILHGHHYKSQPNLGIAVSGGGLRATTFGAGVLNVLDARNQTSVRTGTGGLLQATTYLAGLSGGSWLVTSLAQANFPTIQDLVFGSSDPSGYAGWLTQFDVLAPGTSLAQDLTYIESLLAEIVGKHAAGFPVTITDIFARGLSRHFLNGTTEGDIFNTSFAHGAGITFSGIVKQ